MKVFARNDITFPVIYFLLYLGKVIRQTISMVLFSVRNTINNNKNPPVTFPFKTYIGDILIRSSQQDRRTVATSPPPCSEFTFIFKDGLGLEEV